MPTLAPPLTSPSVQPQQRIFGRRELIPAQPDWLWQIDRGAARTVTWSEDGTLIALGYWGAGDIVGQPLSKLKPYRIECLTSVEATLLPPYSWYQVIDAAVAHIQQMEELLAIVRSRPTDVRLLQLLRWLSRKFGCEVPQGMLIDVRLTHQEIAEVIGTTRVTVTRLLQQFEQAGSIDRNNGRLIVVFADEVD